jgi:lactoylglutathione lyase
MLHVMLRVGDLDATRNFYEALGMHGLRKSENEAYKYTLEFVGYDIEEKSTVFEFTYNWGKSAQEYELGNAYNGTILGLDDLDAAHQKLQQLGVKGCEISNDEFGRKIVVDDPTGYPLVCYELAAATRWVFAHNQ